MNLLVALSKDIPNPTLPEPIGIDVELYGSFWDLMTPRCNYNLLELWYWGSSLSPSFFPSVWQQPSWPVFNCSTYLKLWLFPKLCLGAWFIIYLLFIYFFLYLLTNLCKWTTIFHSGFDNYLAFPMVMDEKRDFTSVLSHFYTIVKQEVMEGHDTIP